MAWRGSPHYHSTGAWTREAPETSTASTRPWHDSIDAFSRDERFDSHEKLDTIDAFSTFGVDAPV